MIVERGVDIHQDEYANVLLSSSTTIFQRIGTVDVAPSTMSFFVVPSPERKYSVLLLEPNACVARECFSIQVSSVDLFVGRADFARLFCSCF